MKNRYLFVLLFCFALLLPEPGSAAAGDSFAKTSAPERGSRSKGLASPDGGESGGVEPLGDYAKRLGLSFGETAATEASVSPGTLSRTKKTGEGRSSSMVKGINSRLFTPLGLYQLSFAGEGHADASGYLEEFNFGDVRIVPEAGVYWHSNHSPDYYGPVYGEGPRFSPRASETAQEYSPYMGMTVDVEISDGWSAFINGEVSFPGDRVRDNSAVDSSHTQSVTTGIVYTFQ